MQKTSPSSFELSGVGAAELERDCDRTDAAREEGVGDDLTLAAEVCVLSLDDGNGLRCVVEGVALGDRRGDRARVELCSVSLSFCLLLLAEAGFGFATPFFFRAAEAGFADSLGAGRFLPATAAGLANDSTELARDPCNDGSFFSEATG